MLGVKLLRNSKTHQIGVVSPRNVKFDNAIKGIEEAIWDEAHGMWILPESYQDEVEYHLQRCFVTATPSPVSKPMNEEPAKVIPLNPAKPDQKKEIRMSEPEKPAAPAPAEKPGTEEAWFKKLMEWYTKAKGDKLPFATLVVKFLGSQARKHPEIQKQVLLDHKTYDRLFKYIYEQAKQTIPEENRKGTQVATIEENRVYSWVLDYIFLDDLEEIKEEERKAAEAAEKRRKQEEERKEKERKRKERADKKAAKEAKAKAEAEKQESVVAAESEQTASEPAPSEQPELAPATEPDSETEDPDFGDDQVSLF